MNLTVREFRKKAKRKKIPGYSRMNGKQLREALGIKYQEPPVITPEVSIQTRETPSPQKTGNKNGRYHWPEGKPMPDTYSKNIQPCPNCRRVLLDNMGQAVVLRSTRDGLAYFRCRACGHRWKLQVVPANHAGENSSSKKV